MRYVCVSVWVWAEVDVRSLSTVFFEAGSLSQTQSPLNLLVSSLASQLASRIPSFAFHGVGNTGMSPYPTRHLCEFWELNSKSSYLWGKCFNCWAINPRFKKRKKEKKNPLYCKLCHSIILQRVKGENILSLFPLNLLALEFFSSVVWNVLNILNFKCICSKIPFSSLKLVLL